MAIGSDKNVRINLDAKDNTRRGLTSAQRNLRKTSREAETMSGRFRSLARATMVLEGPLGGTAGRLSGLATLMGSVNAGAVTFGASVATLTAVAYQSLQAFAEFEKQTFQINSLLEQTGNAAGLTGEQIEMMARDIGLATLESTEGVREAATTLLTFRAIAGDAFERTLNVAADLAATTNVDLRGAIIMLGKALEDPITNMSNLRRAGVSFTNQQKEMISQMQRAGDAAAAQAELLGILEGQMGGTARAAGGGLAGAVDAVIESWNRLLEGLSQSGAGTAATITMKGLATALQLVNEAIAPTDSQRLEQLNEQLKGGATVMDAFKRATLELFPSLKMFLILSGHKKKSVEDEINAIKARMAIEKAARVEAAIDSMFVQEQMNAEKQQEQDLAASKKATTEEQKRLNSEKEKAAKAAQAYIDSLKKEEEALFNSLLTKSQQEDVALQERLEKLQMFREQNIINDQEHQDAAMAAIRATNMQMTQINREELEKREKDYVRMKQRELAVTRAALGDISSLMSSESRALFNVGKAAAIADATIRSYQAYTTTLGQGGYFAKPLAMAALIAGLAQVAKIASTKMSAARQTGGVVLGGRTYLVGERGPELFTAPTSGNIINNNETRNMGGNTNVVNVTVINETDDQFVTRQQNNIWNSIVDRMNQEGLRFA